MSTAYVQKAGAAEGGVGYEQKMITPSLLKDLHGHRVVPVIRNNPTAKLPRFLGAAKYVDLRDDALFEEDYYALLQELHCLQSTPKPPRAKNPFLPIPDEEVPLALRHDPARYVMPTLQAEVAFDYTDNNGSFVIGAGERAFTLIFSTAGHGSIHIYNDPSEWVTPLHTTLPSRSRTIQIGDAAIIRNQANYWAGVFLDEVLTRESAPSGEPKISFHYFIPPSRDLNSRQRRHSCVCPGSPSDQLIDWTEG